MEEQKLIKDDEIDLLALFKILWQNRKKILYITAGFTLLGIIYALLATPWYQTSIKIMPSGEGTGRLSQYAGLAALVGINLSSPVEDKHAFYPDIIHSDFVLDRVLRHKFKINKYNNPVTLFEFWDVDIDSSEEDWKHKLFEKSKKLLRQNYIMSSIDRKTRLLTLVVKAPEDPMLCAELANFITEQLDYYNKYLRTYKAREKREFIEQSVDTSKKKLGNIQEMLKEFKEQNKDLMSPEKELEYDKIVTERDVQKMVYLELRKQLEVAKIEEIKETETLDILEPASVPFEKIKPKRKIICIAFFFLGFIIAILYIFIHYIWITKRDNIKHIF